MKNHGILDIYPDSQILSFLDNQKFKSNIEI